MEIQDNTNEYRRKVYSTMYTSSMSQIQCDAERGSSRKIIPTSKIGGVREEFKKTFLPLLIDIFELRQMIANYKTKTPFQVQLKSPEEILDRLVTMQREIEESQKWCDGVILQISKGIEEAKETLQFIKDSNEIKQENDHNQRETREKKGWLPRFLSFFGYDVIN